MGCWDVEQAGCGALGAQPDFWGRVLGAQAVCRDRVLGAGTVCWVLKLMLGQGAGAGC